MKQLKKVFLCLALTFGLMTAIAITAQAQDYMKSCTDTQMVIHADAPYKSGYHVTGYQIYYFDSGTYSNIMSSSSSSVDITLSGYSKGYVGRCYVIVHYSNGSYTSKNYGNNLDINTTPIQLTTKNFAASYYSTSSKEVDINVSKPSGMTGSQIELYTPGGRKITSKSITGNYAYMNMPYNKAYKYRARTYFANSTNSKTYYGAWSGYKYMATPNIAIKNGSASSARILIKKMPGVKNCKVYISTSNKGNWKAVGKLRTGRYYTISKCGKSSLKKYQNYYLKIVPVVSKKNYTPLTIPYFWIKTVYR